MLGDRLAADLRRRIQHAAIVQAEHSKASAGSLGDRPKAGSPRREGAGPGRRSRQPRSRDQVPGHQHGGLSHPAEEVVAPRAPAEDGVSTSAGLTVRRDAFSQEITSRQLAVDHQVYAGAHEAASLARTAPGRAISLHLRHQPYRRSAFELSGAHLRDRPSCGGIPAGQTDAIHYRRQMDHAGFEQPRSSRPRLPLTPRRY